MVKLIIEGKKLSDFEPELLKFVEWKSITLDDIDGLSEEIVSKYLPYMSKSVIKHLIKKKQISTLNLSDDEWENLIVECINSGFKDIFNYIQIPYSVASKMVNRKNSYYLNEMLSTQHSIPADVVLKKISGLKLNEILRTNSNPAIIDFMFTKEGIEIFRKRNISSLTYITSTESKKLGLTTGVPKNRRITPELLRRAGACDAGSSYCTRILKELGVDSITWDEAVMTIRNNPKLQNRPSLMTYMSWIKDNSRF